MNKLRVEGCKTTIRVRRWQNNTGLSIFRNLYHPQYSLVVGGDAMPLEKFFTGNLANLL